MPPLKLMGPVELWGMRSLSELIELTGFDLSRLREKKRKYLPVSKFLLAAIRTGSTMSHWQLVPIAS
jgi:hypothetical protein